VLQFERSFVLKRLLPAACAVSFLCSLFAQTLKSEEKSRPRRKDSIRHIIFQNAALLSSEEKREISRALRSGGVEAASLQADFSEEAAEQVRATYQNSGYFKAEVEAKAVPIGREAAPRYDIVVQVLQTGKQYRLGDLQLIHRTAFPERRLRDLFPVQRGEIFNREKIARGLDNLRRLYGSKGYVNFTSVPDTKFDEQQAIVNLQVDIDEGRAFHWGKLHLDGMRNHDSTILLKAWDELQGQIYSSGNQDLERFFRRFFRPLRKDTSLDDCVITKVDDAGATVDVYLNLIWNPELIRHPAKTDRVARSVLPLSEF